MYFHLVTKNGNLNDSVGCENGQDACITVKIVSCNLASGKKADKRNITQCMSHDLQLGARRAEVSPAAARTAHIDSAGNSPRQMRPRLRPD